MENETGRNQEDTAGTAPKFDPHIVPAETAARQEREGSGFMHTPSVEDDQNREGVDPEGIDTTSGYTVDQEGLTNNYAIEPEMYINEPGDLREKEAAETAERASELENVNEDEEGKLTMEGDRRGKGPGII